jgi:hypothetical protein
VRLNLSKSRKPFTRDSRPRRWLRAVPRVGRVSRVDLRNRRELQLCDYSRRWTRVQLVFGAEDLGISHRRNGKMSEVARKFYRRQRDGYQPRLVLRFDVLQDLCGQPGGELRRVERKFALRQRMFAQECGRHKLRAR